MYVWIIISHQRAKSVQWQRKGKKCIRCVAGHMSRSNPDSSSVDSDSSSEHVVSTKKSTVSGRKAP